MRNTPVVVLCCGVLLAFLPSLAQGQEDEEAEYGDEEGDMEDALTPEQLTKMHQRFDQNGDGKASMQEVMNYAQAMGQTIASKDIGAILDEIDTSKDGKLSLQEHMDDIQNQAGGGGDEDELKELESRKTVEAAKFRAADVNGDQVLDQAELTALFYPETHEGVLAVTAAETMRQKDKNRDGKLTPNEFWESDALADDDMDLSEEENQDFSKLDVNGDGHIDQQELLHWESGRFHTHEAMKKLFEIADKDGDMHLSAQELADGREQIAASDAQYHLIEWVEHLEL